MELLDLSLSTSVLTMAQLVSLNNNPRNELLLVLIAADTDYQPVDGQLITFDTGDVTKTHTIVIHQDSLPEKDPNEYFYSNIALGPEIVGQVSVNVPLAQIMIMDDEEPENGLSSRPIFRPTCSLPCCIYFQHSLWLAMTSYSIPQVKRKEKLF